jgi:hypothetical protein
MAKNSLPSVDDYKEIAPAKAKPVELLPLHPNGEASEPFFVHFPREIHATGITRKQGTKFLMLMHRLVKEGATLENGKPAGVDKTSAVKWLIEQYA